MRRLDGCSNRGKWATKGCFFMVYLCHKIKKDLPKEDTLGGL